jgi:hypothetical protein
MTLRLRVLPVRLRLSRCCAQRLFVRSSGAQLTGCEANGVRCEGGSERGTGTTVASERDRVTLVDAPSSPATRRSPLHSPSPAAPPPCASEAAGARVYIATRVRSRDSRSTGRASSGGEGRTDSRDGEQVPACRGVCLAHRTGDWTRRRGRPGGTQDNVSRGSRRRGRLEERAYPPRSSFDAASQLQSTATVRVASTTRVSRSGACQTSSSQRGTSRSASRNRRLSNQCG